MKTIFKWIVLAALVALMFSCSGGKSIVGTNWIKGSKGHQDKAGNFSAQPKCKRYRGFTKG